jgi:hypothetical protein
LGEQLTRFQVLRRLFDDLIQLLARLFEIALLRRKVARLERKLKQAELIIEIQKKVALTLDAMETAEDGEKD